MFRNKAPSNQLRSFDPQLRVPVYKKHLCPFAHGVARLRALQVLQKTENGLRSIARYAEVKRRALDTSCIKR